MSCRFGCVIYREGLLHIFDTERQETVYATTKDKHDVLERVTARMNQATLSIEIVEKHFLGPNQGLYELARRWVKEDRDG